MNNKINSLINATNITTTEKGDVAYKTTTSNNLDLFTSFDLDSSYQDVEATLNAAWSENKKLAFKNILYKIDVRKGKSENNFANHAIFWLFKHHKNTFKIYFELLVKITRWDRILNQFNKFYQEDKELTNWIALKVLKIVDYYSNTKFSKESYLNQSNWFNNVDNINYIYKWFPSINTSNNIKRLNARYWASIICKFYKINVKNSSQKYKYYRKWLKDNRDKYCSNLLEKHLSNKDYQNINILNLPKKAFLNHTIKLIDKLDQSQWDTFFETIKNNPNAFKINTIQPHNIINKINNIDNRHKQIKDKIIKIYELFFDALSININTSLLPVIDSSGSMTFNLNSKTNATYLDVAYAIGIISATKNQGEFKNVVLKFSNECDLVKFDNNDSLLTKMSKMYNGFCGTTNLDAVYQAMYDIALKDKSNLPTGLLIVSDMQFDNQVYVKDISLFEYWKNQFNNIGCKLPIIVYWNVANRTTKPVLSHDNNVINISGFSSGVYQSLNDIEKLIELSKVDRTVNITPYEVMLKVLSNYDKHIEFYSKRTTSKK